MGTNPVEELKSYIIKNIANIKIEMIEEGNIHTALSINDLMNYLEDGRTSVLARKKSGYLVDIGEDDMFIIVK